MHTRQALGIAATLSLFPLVACHPSSSGSNSVGASIPPSVEALPEPEERDIETPIPPTHPDPGVVCSWTRRDYTHGSQTYPALAQHFDVVYPGADLQGRTLAGGIPAPITAPRAGGSIVMSNANGSLRSSVELDEVSLANVTEAVNAILREQPEEFPADLVISIKRLRAREEIQLELAASASYMGLFDASASFEWREDHRVSNFLVTLRQNFFTIAFERPSRQSEFYAPGVSASDFANQVFEGSPACYVSEVTYGRVFYLLIQATDEESAMSATLSANIELGVWGGGGDGAFRYLEDFHDLTIEAYAYGGDQDAVLASIAGGLGSLNEFMADLRTANDVRSARPISYTVRDLASDLVVKNGYSVMYDYSSCTFPGECVPTLLSPLGDRLDNGCAVDPDSLEWRFQWSATDCAEKYMIQVFRPQGGMLFEREATGTSFTHRASSGFRDVSGWKWRVRAFAFGEWHPWSGEGAFSLEALNSDCITGVRLYTHPNFQGDSLFLEPRGEEYDLERINGWDDEIDSFRLYNVAGLTLFEDPKSHGYGASFHFTHSCPNTEEHGFRNNSASVLRFDR